MLNDIDRINKLKNDTKEYFNNTVNKIMLIGDLRTSINNLFNKLSSDKFNYDELKIINDTVLVDFIKLIDLIETKVYGIE